MNEPASHPQLASGYREREYQDPHYHDEEPEIQNDDLPRHNVHAAMRRQVPRIPQPKRRFYED